MSVPWDHTKSTWLDEYVLAHWMAKYPRANVTVINRRGVAVCGCVVPNAEERFCVVEPAVPWESE